MLIPVLLDPWLLEFSSDAPDDEMNARAGALRLVFSELKVHYPLEILPFFGPDEYAVFWEKFANYKGADKRNIAQWVNALALAEDPPPVKPATITDTPCPDLPEPWSKVLAARGVTDDPPYWRSPMLFTPVLRKPSWPDNDEVNFSHTGALQKRNLVPIERYQEHTFFISDIDPWRLGCVGNPKPEAPLRERTASCMRLPRAPQIHSSLPLAQLVTTLAGIRDWRGETEDCCFYLPPASWNPIAEEKLRWRNATTFPKKRIPSGKKEGEYGYLDRYDQIWLWHGDENHWDVQTQGGGYKTVSYDGRILKGID